MYKINSEKLKIALELPDISLFFVQKLIKLKIEYENVFDEKLTIKQILDINDISSVINEHNYLYNKLKTIVNKEKLNINQRFMSRLKYRIYYLYVDSDFI